MTVRIGDLDTRVILEVPSRAPDGGGGAIVTWNEVTASWAQVRPISGEERLLADQVAGRLTHSVVIRHRTDVVPAMRFRANARILEIVAVFDSGPGRFLKCLCEERYL
jgi:SPP1 family predicted phage head-tail adaptor